MPILKIEDVDGLNGEYEFATLDTYTSRELHFITQESGVRPKELEDALDNGNVAVVIAMSRISLHRAGKPKGQSELLWDAKPNAFKIVKTDAEEAAAKEAGKRPPDSSASGTENSPAEKEKGGGNEPPSGTPLNGGGDDLPEIDPSRIGAPI
jgi:hypothetical protein